MSSRTRQPLAKVVGENCKRIRDAAALSKDELARHARDAGLRWDASKVGRFESGSVAPTFGTVLAVSLALSKAIDGPVTLADLVQFDGNVILTRPGVPDPLGAAVAGVCRGESWPESPVDIYGADELVDDELIKERAYVEVMKRVMAEISSAQAESIAAGVGAAVLRRSGLAEDRLAQRLGVNPDELALMSSQLWAGRTFSEERDLRAGPEANAQNRGQVSRTLQADLARLKERRANGG
jgi:predicted transcriptional regulator